jgi:Putative peptidoglycan binding domain
VKRIALALILGSLAATIAYADEFDVLSHDFFRPTDSLAQRDEYGLVHQGPHVNATDFAPRYYWRWMYYFKVPEQLILDPAYVGSMQTALRRLGYYCGPIDGVFTPGVADAIARLQKNYSMHVTGTLTDPVRRALHMP